MAFKIDKHVSTVNNTKKTGLEFILLKNGSTDLLDSLTVWQ